MSKIALTTTVHELPNDRYSISVEDLENNYSKALKVLSINDNDITDDSSIMINIGDTIMLSGEIEAVEKAGDDL